MRILIGVALDGKGGIDAYIKRFVEICNDENIQTDTLITNNNNWQFPGKLIEIANLHDKKNIYKTINNLNKSNHYDAAYWNISTSLMYPYVEASKQAGIKNIITHSHAAASDTTSFIKTKILNILNSLNRNRITSNSTHLAACSDNAAKWLFGDKKYTYIKNPVDIKKYKYTKTERPLLTLGLTSGFYPLKNVEFAINVFNAYHKINPNSQLILAGTGPLENQLKAKANKATKFIGQQKDVSKLLSSFDIFMFPSIKEGFGMGVVEAQANGLPCLVSNGVPKEALLVDVLINQLDLNKDKWVEAINNIVLSKDREKYNKKVEKAGFNSNTPKEILNLL